MAFNDHVLKKLPGVIAALPADRQVLSGLYMCLTPFEVLPSATILSSASPAPRIYKRRKTRFSDRKGNR